jgi:hypothetical protein
MKNNTRYVFVCGLHRSGTTALARAIGNLQGCTSFQNTGAVMDEGQHLQDVYRHDLSYGGPGRFGFASRAHLTESSPRLTRANAARLRQSWEPYWDSSKPIRVEKTPSNLLMTRFLQAAFENTYFVVIKRHPVAVSLATQKWSRTPLHSLFEHWLRCYEAFDEDKKHLDRLFEVTYEDYIQSPKTHLEKIATFIGTASSDVIEGNTTDYNSRYFDRWVYMLHNSSCRAYYRRLAATYERRFTAHGYSVASPLGESAYATGKNDPFERCLSGSLRLAAEISCFAWRLGRVSVEAAGRC